MRYRTIVTLHKVELPQDTSTEFGDGLQFTQVPAGILRDVWLKQLSNRDRETLRDAKHALIADYECEGLGEPDRRWNGQNPKGKQQVKYELAMMANLAFWLVTPSPACMGYVFDCLEDGTTYRIQRSASASRLLCHPDDAESRLTVDSVAEGG